MAVFRDDARVILISIIATLLDAEDLYSGSTFRDDELLKSCQDLVSTAQTNFVKHLSFIFKTLLQCRGSLSIDLSRNILSTW